MQQKKVSDLVAGDLVDLEGDPYADEDPTWEFEYGEVEDTERETDDCVRVDFANGGSIGFPPDHLLTLSDRRLTPEQAERVNAAIKELWATAEECGLTVLSNDDEADDGTPQVVLTLEGYWPREED